MEANRSCVEEEEEAQQWGWGQVGSLGRGVKG